MVSSISVDPPTIPAASAVASALKRGPTAPGPSTERTFLLTPLDLIAGRIARARVRFQVGAHGAVDGVDVGLADATPDGGMPPQRQSAMSALASATCAMAPFSDVPQGTRVTYWFDRIAAGFDAGGVTEDERSSSPAPRIRAGSVNVNGRLPPEVIERIVKQRFGRFRLCYEAALKTNPTLTGRITVKFVIDRTGAVAAARDGGSDLPDANAVACVVRAFGDLSFPQPEGGIVTVVYPMMFFPGA
jgi:hypothetical protein